jgi:hypothetical protein
MVFINPEILSLSDRPALPGTRPREGASSMLMSVAGLLIGGIAGATWGYFGSGGYESMDSAVGTGIMGCAAGLIVGGVVSLLRAGRRRRP